MLVCGCDCVLHRICLCTWRGVWCVRRKNGLCVYVCGYDSHCVLHERPPCN